MDVTKSTEWRRYVEDNEQSRRHAENVGKIVPSGSSRSLLRHPPFPFFVESAAGISSIDLDGNERLDFHNNYTTLIHGHGHPEILAAVAEQLPKGTSYSAPVVQEARLGEILTERLGGVDQVVFNNSGSEAVMVALRIARAVTGKQLIGKFEGGYHGSSDFVMVGGHDIPAIGDSVKVSRPKPDLAGLPDAATEQVVLIKYNDVEAVTEAVSRYGDEMAAIIVEPIMFAGGVIPATPEFLRVLRAETARKGILLICDEVVTLRQAVGGAQGYYGLEPDLTTMAKTIGGGFPIGAVGGKREIMQCLNDPSDGGTVANLGTFSANPMSVTAGAVAMELMDEAAIAHINTLGDKAREGLQSIIRTHDVAAQVSGTGSLFQIHWTEHPINDARASMSGNPDLVLLNFIGMCNRGVQLSMRGNAALSTPMTEETINTMLNAFDETVGSMRAEGYC
ncbi:MAG: aspartate aminotransferase family protein [Gammaproteobacteria bacterium]